MARGSTFRRCPCRDAQGKQVKNCRKAHGTWCYKIEIAPDPETGMRRQLSRGGFGSRNEAEAAMRQAIVEVDGGTWVSDRNVSLAEWLDTWLDAADERLAAKTMADYRSHVTRIWAPELGHHKLRDVRRHHIERVLRGLAAPINHPTNAGNVGRRVAKRSPTTIAAYRRTIRTALSAAQRRGLINANPAEGRLDSLPAAEPAELQIWEPEHTATFLEFVSTDRLAALYELAAYAGLRRAELCGLRWSDLDDDGAGITIRQTIVELASKDLRAADRVCPDCRQQHTGLLMKRPKSRAGRRWVPLVQHAQAAIASRLAMVADERDACGSGYVDHDLVFSALDGRPLRPSSVTAQFEKLAARAGLPPIRLHDTRHGACSLLLAGGVPIEVVQLILGHANSEVTRRVYTHVLKRATAQQVEQASELLTQYRRSHSAHIEGMTEATDEEGDGMN